MAQSAAQSAQDTGLGDIVVTAQHRKENVQTTPIAIAVFNSADLKLNGISSLSDLSAIAPDIGFAITAGKSMVTIRGISSRDTNENGDPAVTVSTDDFYLNRPYALNASMYDIDRIEVLRGPQGTLSGRNAVGGAINVVTAKPTDTPSGYASVQYGNYNDLEVQGAFNMPVGDRVQMRASFFSQNRDGFRDNGAVGRGDDADNKSGRLQIAFQPTDRLSGQVTLQYTKMGGLGDVMQNVPFVYTATGALVHEKPAGLDSSAFTLRTQPYLRVDEKQIRGRLAYDLGSVEVTALGGYDSTDWNHATDQSLPTGAAYQFQEQQHPRTVNAELRIASKGKGPLQWQVGGFYFHESSSLWSADASPLASGGFDDYFGYVYANQATSKAVYAQASYALTPDLTLTGGMRYTHDDKSESGYYGDLTDNIVYAYQSGNTRSSKPTFHVAIDRKLTAGHFLYAKFDTGYKAGGFNLGGTTYRPETVTSWELGSKNRFLDDTLQLNLAAFYSRYTDQQVSNFTYLPSGEAVTLVQNAGASRIFGLESELIYTIPVIGRLNLTANYLNARYTNFLSIADPSDPSQSGNVQLKGNRPPQSPTWSLAGGIEHGWHLVGGTVTTRLQTKFQSATNFSFYNYGSTRQAAYTMSDLYVTFKPGQGQWTATAFLKNLENSMVLRDAEHNLYGGAYSYAYYPPRTYGLRLQYDW